MNIKKITLVAAGLVGVYAWSEWRIWQGRLPPKAFDPSWGRNPLTLVCTNCQGNHPLEDCPHPIQFQ